MARKKNPIPKYPDMIRAVGDKVTNKHGIYEKTGKYIVMLYGTRPKAISVHALGDWVRFNRQPMTVHGYIPSPAWAGEIWYVLKNSNGALLVAKTKPDLISLSPRNNNPDKKNPAIRRAVDKALHQAHVFERGEKARVELGGKWHTATYLGWHGGKKEAIIVLDDVHNPRPFYLPSDVPLHPIDVRKTRKEVFGDKEPPRKGNPAPKKSSLDILNDHFLSDEHLRSLYLGKNGDKIQTGGAEYRLKSKNEIELTHKGKTTILYSPTAIGDWVRYRKNPHKVVGFEPSSWPGEFSLVLQNSKGERFFTKSNRIEMISSPSLPRKGNPAPKTKRKGNPYVDDGKINRIKKSLREVLRDLEESNEYDVTPISSQPRRQIPSSATKTVDFLEHQDRTAEFFYGPVSAPIPPQRLLSAPSASKKKPGRPKKQQAESTPTEKRKPGRPKKQQ